MRSARIGDDPRRIRGVGRCGTRNDYKHDVHRLDLHSHGRVRNHPRVLDQGVGRILWQVLLGVLYIAFGAVLVSQTVASAQMLTYVLGLLLLISGLVRILLGFNHWKDAGWVMLLSGAFGVLAGLVILTGFPMTGLWCSDAARTMHTRSQS
jgi:hypothetical protein